MTRWKNSSASGRKTPYTSSSMMTRFISSRSDTSGRIHSNPRAANCAGYTVASKRRPRDSCHTGGTPIGYRLNKAAVKALLVFLCAPPPGTGPIIEYRLSKESLPLNIPIYSAIALLGSLAACSGGGSAPGPAPTPGPLAVTPAALTFLGPGPGQVQTVTASESWFSGPFSLGNGCSGIATVAPHAGSTTSFDVTPNAAGTCTLTVSGAPGQTQPVAITITTTSVGGH